MTTTLMPLGGSKSEAFDPRQLDRLGTKNGSLLKSRGNVLVHSTFDPPSNFDGWNNHYTGNRPVAPVGKTSLVSWGSSSSLVLAPSVSTTVPNTSVNNQTSVYKRMSRPADDLGVVSFSAMIAIVGDSAAATTQVPFQSWGIGIDSQRWDNGSRMFFRLHCNNTGDMTPKFGVWAYDKPATGTPDTWTREQRTGGGTIDIPGAVGVSAGVNERKLNPNYVRLTVDYSLNGGLGGYLEAQINNKVYDLRGLLPANKMAWDDVLKGNSLDDFRGGFNIGAFITRRTSPVAQVQMVIGQAMLTYGDTRIG